MTATDFVPLRTYVIEKQFLMAKALRAFFDQQPYAHVVGDATEVNAAELQRTRPDLLMFGLDNATGELTAAIATARAINPAMRVCILSSYPNPDLLQRCMAAGADGFILKDISMNELDVAMRVMSAGSCYVDPRLAGRMLKRRLPGAVSADALSALTEREADILRHIATGLANKEIGAKLKLSEKTIKNYVTRILSKLNVNARTGAAVYAIKAGMI